MAENDHGRNNDSQLSSAASRTAGKTGESGETRQTGKPAGEKREAAGCKTRRIAEQNKNALKNTYNVLKKFIKDPVDPVTGAYCDERTDFTTGQTLPLLHPLPLFGTATAWPDRRGLERFLERIRPVREQGKRVDIISPSHAELRLRR